MTKNDCIRIFNASIRGTPIDFSKDIIPLISDYLTEIKCEKSNELISLIIQNPQLTNQTFPKIIDYFCNKYTINSIIKDDRIILYY